MRRKRNVLRVAIGAICAAGWLLAGLPCARAQDAPAARAAGPGPGPGRAGPPDYRLGAGDRIKFTVFGQPDMTGDFEVDGEGNLPIPLLGLVQARGHTVAELTEKIRAALDKDFIVEPRVSLEVVNYRPFFILGQVNKPGRYDYVNGLTVRQAVAIAGGFTRRARVSDVTLIRKERTKGANIETTVDLDAVVLPGDTIDVERRLF